MITNSRTMFQNLYVTRLDRDRLLSLLESNFTQAISNGRFHLTELKERIERATVVDSKDMLPEVITMNTTFKLLDVPRKEAETFTLVYPDEACIAEGKLSILSPLGAELLGRRVGDFVRLRVLNRDTEKRVENISFQPERCGVLNL
ncbi:GreA/GreB family elongation factor [Aporhodopirellula aestuarii]|uniref:GreA/GreB family elongation factor n=1 Tax=Aporhodopirellula aestuarii TaxID=2950107 RepID=A0ABT0TZX5_9BACT|nr:GreA/GreB family elongation factor [Aporhodopirellula aestuarii]MCM2370168.1 GreA/GreB family elongation factor [Aporhodopirellula aestuarii]